nr:IS110 family transposase [Frankia gtarii]
MSPLPVRDAVYCVGIDWAAKSHGVCVFDRDRKKTTPFTIEHSAAGFVGLGRRLSRLGEAGLVPIAIGRPDGRLVDVLLEAGSGAKSDVDDTEVIADYLLCRARRLTIVPQFFAETRALRTVVRARDDLVDMRVAATNPLSALLDAHWLGTKAIFADVEPLIALAFLGRYPTARHAERLGKKRIAVFCAKHRYSRGSPASALLARLHATPTSTLDETLCEAVRGTVLAFAVLQALDFREVGRSMTATPG